MEGEVLGEENGGDIVGDAERLDEVNEVGVD